MADTRISGDAAITPDGSEYMPVIQVGAPVTAGAFAPGTAYVILSVGTTDFTAIGAASNTVGVGFVATGAGSGTGTAGPTSNKRATSQAIADLAGGSRGLYTEVLSALPTISGTGLSTWLNQGAATIADRATGLTLAKASQGAADSASARIKTPAHSAPYTVNARLAVSVSVAGTSQNGLSAGIGWYDGTNKLHVLALGYSNGWIPVVQKWTNPTTISANDFVGAVNVIPEPEAWLHLVDDATNVKFGYSRSGDPADAHVLFSVAKASGHLGSSGYANLLVYGSARSADLRVHIASWEEAAGAAF